MNYIPQRSIALLILAAALAAAANSFGPQRIPWVQDWSLHIESQARDAGLEIADLTAARDAVEQGTHLVVDARPEEEYAEGHLPTALSMPNKAGDDAFFLFLEEVFSLYGPDYPMMVYCSGELCEDSLQLCVKLQEQGVTNLLLFVGGYKAWIGEELSVE